MTTAAALADRLTTWTVSTLEAVQHRHLPGWRIPRTFAGHEVGADVRADICFTLTHLADAGVTRVGGDEIDGLLAHLLGQVDGASTHTFFSYRIAETLGRRGPFADNPLVATMDEAQRAELERAVDSSDWLELLDGGHLPRNYAAVLARCEKGRVDLGLTDDDRLSSLVDRVREVLDENPRRALDDSNDRVGRYDIYTADVWLFCEPLAPRIGPVWEDGLLRALDLVAVAGARDGSAVAWGRSVGDLAAALTLELAALSLADGHDPERAGLWLRRAADATQTVMAGFDDDGVSTAHRGRAQDGYRGPARRLQLTFDLLGKVAWAAGALRRAPAGVVAAPATEAYPDGDDWIRFEDARPAGVWAHRSTGADFVLPFVGITRSHYLPALHQPGTWEVPIDRDLPTWTPLVTAGLGRHTAGGLPTTIEQGPHSLTATWDGFPISGRGFDGDDATPPLEGARRAQLSVEGRTVVLDDQLTFARAPRTVSMAIPEVAGRPLRVEWECNSPHATTAIDVSGLAEWRTPTSEIARIHQIDLDPATALSYRARVTPLLRVASTEVGHHYSRSLYGPMADRVVAGPSPVGWNSVPDPGFRRCDLLHLHWPEWLAFDDLDAHRAIIAELADHDVPVVWTAHNLTPHQKQPDAFDPIYALWAEAAGGVIHHSAWGEERMRARYRFGEHCLHEVVPHGHFGGLWAEAGLPDRAEAEQRLGLNPAALRIGIVGAPRTEKLVQVVMEAVAACGREDVQLACWSVGPDDVVPDDPRIVAASDYRMVAPEAYATRLAACDVLALVFDPDGEMLATGAAADAIGLGLPVLRSDWGYLVEALGNAGIPCGHTVESVASAIDALSPEVLATAAAAARDRREQLDWAVLAPRTADLFERVVLRRHDRR